MIKVDDAQRRARLVRRHRLDAGGRAETVEGAAGAMVCLHATDPSTVYLSAWARVEGMAVADLERALYQERTLLKQLAMRRTLFVFPTEILAHALGAPGERVAGQERKRLVKQVEEAELHIDGVAWLAEAEAEVLGALRGDRELTSAQLREQLPILEGSTIYGEGKSWGGEVPIAPRVLSGLAAAGGICRASNDGGWTTSRPRWAKLDDWLGREINPTTSEEGYRELIERWLRTFGPGTEADIKWWLGSTVTAVRKALDALDVVEVELDGGGSGYILANDIDPVEGSEPWAALLPGLDPTPMGWFERDWYMGPHREQVTDRNGNIGPTAWWDGRIVGGWRQDDEVRVELQLLEDLGAEAEQALAAEAERLTAWLDGSRVSPRFPSPLSQA